MVFDKLPGFGSDADEQADEQVSDTDADTDGDDVVASDRDEDAPEVEEVDAGYSEDDVFPEDRDWMAEYEPPEGRVIDDVARLHRDFIAPTDMDTEPDSMIRSGNQWVQSFFIDGWPQQARPGFLEALFSDATYDTDISIHIEPRSDERAKKDLKENIGGIKREYREQKKHESVDARDTKKDLKDAQQMYDLVSRTKMTMFDVSMYVNSRAMSPDDIWDRHDDFKQILERPPSDLTARVAKNEQDRAMRSAAPVGNDEMDWKTSMMGGAVGCMMPFSSATIIEEDGVDFGVQPYNGSPVIVDRFGRDTGYCMLTIGNIGSGKSFSTKLNIIRTLMRNEDVEVIMLDPLEGFVGVNEALNGNEVMVGGDVGLNPLELKETPQHVLDKADDLDPYAAKLKDVMSFFNTFFNLKDGEGLTKEERGVLRRAVRKAYEDANITRDPATHSNPSPTIADVKKNLRIMSDPDKQLLNEEQTDTETSVVADTAADLLVGMEAFSEGGEFENLTRPTDIDITDERVTYLNLTQQEGRDGLGLMMQLLFNAVYERAKQSPNKVIFCIDEARYLMRDAENLAFLEQAVRHSRHYDLSIQFITQTVDEFFQQPEAEAIADNCSLIQLNRVEGLDDELAQSKLGLNKRQAEFVRNAQPGSEELNYSEALLGIRDKGWVPIHIRASDQETGVVDYEPESDTLEDLPGYAGGSAKKRAEQLEKAVETSHQQREPEELGVDGDMPTLGGADTEAARISESMSEERLKQAVLAGDFRDISLSVLAEHGAQAIAGDRFRTAAPNASDVSDRDSIATTGNWGGSGNSAQLYHVRLAVDDDETTATDELPVLAELGDGAVIFQTDPPRIALRAGNYNVGFDAVVGAAIDKEQIASALYDLDQVSDVAVTDITNVVGWSSHLSGGDADPEELADVSAGNNQEAQAVFEQLKQEVEQEDFEEWEDSDELDDITDEDEVSFEEVFKVDTDDGDN